MFFNSTNGWKFDLVGMVERPMMMEYVEEKEKYDEHRFRAIEKYLVQERYEILCES